MNRIAWGIVAAFTLIGIARAAGPYDGSWEGSASPGGRLAGRCAASVQATIQDNHVTGTAAFRSVTARFQGAVASDGNFTGSWSSIPFTGKFDGGSFTGTYYSSVCKDYVRVVMHKG